MPRKREPGAPRVVHRTARCGLRVTRAQRNRLFGLLRSAGDVWCCALDLNRWRRPAPRRDAWFAAAARRKAGDASARYPRRKRALMPVRWYAGTFTLDGRALRIPVVRGCPPLQVRLDRDVPYPADQVRSVTLGFHAGRLYLDVTAEVPVATYPPGQGPDPRLVGGVDLGIIHPYALAGPGGQLLLVSGRAIRAECRQHLRDRKGRSRAAARRAPKPGQRGSPALAAAPPRRAGGRGPAPAAGPPGPARGRQDRGDLGRRAPDRDARGRRPPRGAEPGRGPAAQPAHPGLAGRAPHPCPGR